MRKPFTALLISSLLLTGCGGSSLNPLNWFGRGQPVPVVAEGANPLIPAKRSGSFFRRGEKVYTGVPIHRVTTLKIERVPGGALVRATGVAQVQGQYDVALVSTNNDQPVNGVLTYEFRAEMPKRRLVQGSEWSRTVTIATFLTDNELDGVRSINVVGAQNALSARRR